MIVNNISVPHNTVRQPVSTANYNDIPLFSIGRGSYIVNASIQCGLPANLHIGQFCSLATNITFMLQIDKDYTRVTTSSDQLVSLLPGVVLEDPHIIKGQIIIQNDVWIGHNVTIMAGVKIGNGTIIAANSHVVKDTPPYSIVGGNPAKVLKYRFSESQVDELLDIAWWDWSDRVLVKRKPDFALPIQSFIDKYRVEPLSSRKKSNNEISRFLMFPDFDCPYPLWIRIFEEYCELCKNESAPGQLFIYIPESNHADAQIGQLQDMMDKCYDGTGDIYIQVGQIIDEIELFEEADYYVTTRELNTVRHTCIADRLGVKIISGADLPNVFHEDVFVGA